MMKEYTDIRTKFTDKTCMLCYQMQLLLLRKITFKKLLPLLRPSHYTLPLIRRNCEGQNSE